LLRRLERWLDLRLMWVFRRTLVPVTADRHPEPEFAFREMTAAELLEAAADPALELAPQRIEEAAARGDWFFGVFQRERLVGYRWYSSSGSVPCWPGMSIRFAYPQRAYGYRTFTHPEFRGQRLHAYGAAQSDRALLERGCTHTIGYIDATNFASLRAYSRFGALRRIGAVCSVRAFGRQWVFASPGARRHHVTVVAG
jgi:hypothetical protein